MEDQTFIQALRLQNFLSYGAEDQEIKLQPLNVLIGLNASGKSNLIETLGLLQATSGDLAQFIRAGGGVSEWLWKGAKSIPIAKIEATVNYPAGYVSPPEGPIPLRYQLLFTAVGQRLELVDEAVENDRKNNPREADVYFYYRYQRGRPVLNVKAAAEEQSDAYAKRPQRTLHREALSPDQSILSQRKDPDQYPELTYLGNQFSKMRFFREWNQGRNTAPRRPQDTVLPEDFLSENADNLGLVLNDLQHHPETWQRVIENLRKFYARVDYLSFKIHGGTLQIFVHEKGLNQPIPAMRLSDGTLRYLGLLAVLCHPTPPPLICIEEPEIGLHPDILPTIADMLVEASQRTQLVVTTHSDALVSALTDHPESVLICEHDEDGSRVRRLEREPLEEWLEKYSLGELWRMGELGGTRW